MSGRALPESLNRLVKEFTRFPGIGKKSAERMALHVLKSDRQLAVDLARSLLDVKDQIHNCPICHHISDTTSCPVCTDPKRNPTVVCVVEDVPDLLVLEKAGVITGRYHVLGGVISPLDGIGPDDLHIDSLLTRLEGVEEVIVATNPTAEGETTALYLARLLKGRGIKVTRLARGIPVGSDLEYADESTVASAIEGRVTL